MLTRRHTLGLLLAGPLVPVARAEDRCGVRADAVLSKLVADTLPHFAAAMPLCGALAGAVEPRFVNAGRALSSRELNQWHIKATFLLSEEHKRLTASWQKWTPKSVRHSSVLDVRGDSGEVTCENAKEADDALSSAWARKFWAAQQRVLAKAPFWVLAGLAEYLRDKQTAATFDAAAKAARRNTQLFYPLPFHLEGAESVAALFAVARAHGDDKLQAEIRAEDSVLEGKAVPALESREMKVAQRVLLDAWRNASQLHLPAERDGSYHAGLVRQLTELFDQV